ncbi:sensor domain-containing protein [Halorussus gelatinilyticus]|uniref:Sensor domain-containing protein n=1 Tax=Halorussus gelatinilyticus TaxID=2937524 RepID=A0A8U0IL47_9EURY|nr:sensor domain-containing protein [Halorussus gelatinilyticus]UPW00924.1 sensor domain-containing protein [Halorussus gelatinilyticus]
MATDHSTSPSASRLWGVFGVPFRLQTYRNLLYLVLSFPLGLAYFVFLSVGLSLGVGLAITVVGIPILLAVLAISTGLAGVEREIATLLLGVEVESPGWVVTEEGTITERTKRLVTDLGTWKALAYLGTKLVVGVAAFVTVTTLLVTAVSMLAVPLVYDQPGVYVGVVTDAPIRLHPSLYVVWRNLLVGVETVVSIGSWQVRTLPAALGVAGFGVLLGVASLHLLNGLARFSAWYTKLMLGANGELPSLR